MVQRFGQLMRNLVEEILGLNLKEKGEFDQMSAWKYGFLTISILLMMIGTLKQSVKIFQTVSIITKVTNLFMWKMFAFRMKWRLVKIITFLPE